MMYICNKSYELIRIVVLDISKSLASEVHDEAIMSMDEINNYIMKNGYMNMKKYRIVTV